MAKLSQAVREQMATKLVVRRFDDRGKALCAESVVLFNAVLDDQYDDATRRLMWQLAKRHKQAFDSVAALRVNVAGRQIVVGDRHFGKEGVSWAAKADGRAILAGDKGWRNFSYLNGPIADRLIAFDDAVHALTNEVEPAYRKALGALAQFGTGKRLADGWPEAMPIIGGLIPENERALPVVQVAALNAEFDLPPELAEAA